MKQIFILCLLSMLTFSTYAQNDWKCIEGGPMKCDEATPARTCRTPLVAIGDTAYRWTTTYNLGEDCAWTLVREAQLEEVQGTGSQTNYRMKILSGEVLIQTKLFATEHDAMVYLVTKLLDT